LVNRPLLIELPRFEFADYWCGIGIKLRAIARQAPSVMTALAGGSDLSRL